MERILILGPSGTGKTTLSIKLSKLLNIPSLHLDGISFNEGWVLRKQEEIREDLLNFLNDNEKWVIDGNWRKSLDLRLEYADTLIYLDYGLEVSINGVKERNKKYNGKSRPDVPQCIEIVDPEFLNYVHNFEQERGIFLKQKIKNLNKNIKVLVFKSREETEEFIKKEVLQ